MDAKKTLPLHLRLSKKPTPWLRNLPAGEYNIRELEELTNRDSSTIKQRLSILAIPKKYIAISGYPFVIYIWVGIEEYERQNNLKS